MKLKVDSNLCIGCGQCIYLAEKVFKWDDSGSFATATNEEIPESEKSNAIEAMESCPTNAIKEKKEDKVA